MSNNKLKFVVAVLALALGGFLLGFSLSRGPVVRTQEATLMVRPIETSAAIYEPPAAEKENVVELAPVKIIGKASKDVGAARRRPVSKPPSIPVRKQVCWGHELQQQGAPGHSMVLVCE